MKKYLQFSYLVLLPLYFVLDGNNQFWTEIPIQSSLVFFLGVTVTALVLWFLLKRKITGEQSGLIITWLLFHYLFFKIIKSFFTGIIHITLLTPYKYYLPFIAVVVLVFIWMVIKMKVKNTLLLNRFCNLVFVLLVMVELVKAGINFFNYQPPQMYVDKVNFTNLGKQGYPNVYFFILDEYVGSKTLKEDLNFDNSSFHNELRKRNFFVAENPTGNYNFTPFSLLSVLDMGYIEKLDKKTVNTTKGYSECFKQIENNRVGFFFQRNHYSIINNSFFKIAGQEETDLFFIPVKQRLLVNKTFGNVLWEDLLCNIPSNRLQQFLKTSWVRADNYNQDMIARSIEGIRKGKAPLFMYTHLFMPHRPYLRDKEGRLRNLAEVHKETNNPAEMKPYLEYVEYSNSTALKLTDEILKKDKNAVIIIASDHGYRHAITGNKVYSEFNNFISVYSPSQNYFGFTDSMSLVNVFRLVLNNNFDQHFPLLANKMINVNPVLKMPGN